MSLLWMVLQWNQAIADYNRASIRAVMDRKERDSFTAATDQTDLAYGESACLETPPDVFAALDKDFGPFDVDLTANETNFLVKTWYGPGSPWTQDALEGNWARGYGHRKGFSNPPYGAFISKILPVALQEAGKGFESTFLLPMRVTKVFKEIILPYADIYFVDERIQFWYNHEPKVYPNKTDEWEPMGALFDSIVVRFRSRAGVHGLGDGGIIQQPPKVWSWRK